MSAPNTKASKLERLLARQRVTEKQLGLLISEVRRLPQNDTMKILADHVARLTREKETLVKMLGWQEIERQLKAANVFMAGTHTYSGSPQ